MHERTMHEVYMCVSYGALFVYTYVHLFMCVWWLHPYMYTYVKCILHICVHVITWSHVWHMKTQWVYGFDCCVYSLFHICVHSHVCMPALCEPTYALVYC